MTPDKIGKYQIVGKLGQGAMGEVLRGHDPVLNRDVAIKRISSGLDADETLRKRFKREAEAVALLSHPHIITVYEPGFEGELHAINLFDMHHKYCDVMHVDQVVAHLEAMAPESPAVRRAS